VSGPARSRALLGLLGVVVFLGLIFGGDRGKSRGSGGERLDARVARQRADASNGPLVTDVVPLDLARLEPAGGSFEIGRDPFRFGPIDAPPPPRRAPRTEDPAPPPPPPPPPIPVGPKPPSTAHLTFLGSFGEPERQIAVVTSGEEIFNVRIGEVLEGKFVVEEIGFESLDLGFVDFPEASSTRLPVGG